MAFKSSSVHFKNNFNYNMIKGRVAEAIIKELFHVNGYRVYNYGMESTLPQVVDNVKFLKDDIASSIRHMPDYLVQHIETGELAYVEVKYRAHGRFDYSMVKDHPYPNTFFIIVSKENIQWINYSELKAGESLPDGEARNLERCTYFKLDQNKVEEYRSYSTVFFEGVV